MDFQCVHPVMSGTVTLRLTLRSLSGQPTFSIAVVMIIAAAVGTSVALFSVFDGLIFRPLPFTDAARIVHLDVSVPRLSQLPNPAAALASIEQDVASTPLLTNRTRVRSGRLFDEGTEATRDWQIRATQISPGFFPLLGVTPFAGRVFTEEDAAARPRPVLLSYDLWRTKFGSNLSVINEVIDLPGTLRGERWVVIGVMPPKFSFPGSSTIWVPISTESTTIPRIPTYAKIATGASVNAVRAALPHLTVTSLREHTRPRGAFALGMLLAATGLLLLTAWVHVAALCVARAAKRTHETGVRLALGARRSSLLVEYALESALLVGAGMALAWLAAPSLVRGITFVLPAELTMGQPIAPDIRTLIFASIVAGVGFALLAWLPARLMLSLGVHQLLRNGTLGEGTMRTGRLRTGLFIGQVALATTLMYVNGIGFQSFVRVMSVDVGFERAHLLAAKLPMDNSARGLTREQSQAEYASHVARAKDAVARVRQLPGVLGATTADAHPLQPGGLTAVTLRAHSDPQRLPVQGRITYIETNYPAVVGLRFVSEQPSPASGPDGREALATASLAHYLERFGPVVGQSVAVTPILKYRIIGVVADVRTDHAAGPPLPTLFVYLPRQDVGPTLLVRLHPLASDAESGVREVLREVWGSRAPMKTTYIDDAIATSAADYKARTVLVGLAALSSLPLTVIGIAGAIAYKARQERRYIAIELALGAPAKRVKWRVVRESVRSVVIAIPVGLLLGVVVCQALSAYVFGVSPAHWPTVIGAAAIIAAVTWLAAAVPARRAVRLDPAVLLREPSI